MTQLDTLNALVNQPDVIQATAPGYASVNMAGFFARPGNVMLGDETGAALFGMLEPGVFEGHYVFPAATRPKRIIDRCRCFISTMFTDHAAQAIYGLVPIELKASRALTRALGFTSLGPAVSPQGRSCVKYVLERSAWATSSAGFSEA